MVRITRLFGLALIAVSIYACVTALSFPSPYYAFALGLILGLCSFVMVVLSFIRKLPEGEDVPIKFGKGEFNVVKTILLTLIYIICMRPLGFIISSTVFMIVLMWTLNYRKIIWLVVVSLPFVTATYLFFNNIIRVRLPSGPLPF